MWIRKIDGGFKTYLETLASYYFSLFLFSLYVYEISFALMASEDSDEEEQ